MARGTRAIRRLRRRAAVGTARLSERAGDALAAAPRRRFGAALAAALAVNAVLAALLSVVPTEDLPDAPPGTPIEVVFLAPEPEALPAEASETSEAADVAPATPPPALAPDAPPPAETSEPVAPAAPRGPAVDLPRTDATGTPGVVAIDCNRVFEDEARRVACAGGRVVSGWQAEVETLDTDWTRLAERIERARRSLPSAAPLTDPDAARYEAQADARRAARERANAPAPNLLSGVRDVSADGRDSAGDGAVAPPSIITSYGDRKVAEDERRLREDGRILRELGREE